MFFISVIFNEMAVKYYVYSYNFSRYEGKSFSGTGSRIVFTISIN